jgi:peptidoglycan/xylan/chitin deacetylase (PgdA/CDA1 family)
LAAHEVGERLGARDAPIPEHLRPLTTAELHNLQQAGVQLESHGWSHVEIASFDDEQFKADLDRTDDWFRRVLNKTPSLYAVPFGQTSLSSQRAAYLARPYFLADRGRPIARLGKYCWNRSNIGDSMKIDK